MITIPDLESAAIRAAHERIDRAFLLSPQYVHEGLSRRLGMPVIVKIETTNPIRSFKGRGNLAGGRRPGGGGEDRLGPADRLRVGGQLRPGGGLCRAGAGHPGTRVHLARRRIRGKVERMRGLGAQVIQAGDDFDAARAASEAYAAEHEVELLVDGDDPRISTGAATLALEVTDAVAAGDLPTPVVASVPVGNGALINGVGSWLRAVLPDCRVVGVQAEAAPAMARSFEAGRPIDTATAHTFADGIATRVAIPRAVALLPGRVDEIRLVSEEALREAQAVLTEELGITVEGAAAASWAGLLAGELHDGPALLIVTGSNV